MTVTGQGVRGFLLLCLLRSAPIKTMKKQFPFSRERVSRLVGMVLAILLVTLLLASPLYAAIIRTGIICDSGETNCVEAQHGMNIIVYSDAGSTQKFKVTGSTGAVDTAGALGSTNSNSAGGSANPLDITSTLAAFNGSDDFTAIDINLTNANHTSTSNTVQALDVSNITGDADATEYAINVGTGWDRGINVAGGGAVIVGTFTVDTGEVGAAEIADRTASLHVGLREFIECTTDAGADINFSSGADAFPDYINSATNGLGFTLTFDDTGGTEDTAYICGNLTVPPDYVSGGTFKLLVTKDAETGANTEVVNCAGSINGAALGTAGTATVTGASAQVITCTPTLTSLAAGNSVSFEIHLTSGGTMDDTLNIHSVEFQYTATQ